MGSLFTDEDILKIVDRQYSPKVSAHLYVPKDYPNWLLAFARDIEAETIRKLRVEE